jgi:putative transposase
VPPKWDTRDQLANAIFDWIEAWYNPRRHCYTKMLRVDYETANRGMITTPDPSARPGEAHLLLPLGGT